MKPQKQLFRHDPDNGVFGDCHRTAIACALDMDAADVPHFMDGTHGKGVASEAHAAAERWLNERGICQINTLYPGTLTPEEIALTVKNCNNERPGIVFLLGGTSRNGVNHTVVCCDGEIACDPSQTDAGIIGPCDDGFYWVTFFGTLQTVKREPVFFHATPNPDACDHDFKGWEELKNEDGQVCGGTTVCTKCGTDAMSHSLRCGI